MTVEMDGSIRIAWSADAHEGIRVFAPRRGPEELTSFARSVADHALVNRSLPELRAALRRQFDGTFDIESRRERAGATPYVLVELHPPRGTPNPDE